MRGATTVSVWLAIYLHVVRVVVASKQPDQCVSSAEGLVVEDDDVGALIQSKATHRSSEEAAGESSDTKKRIPLQLLMTGPFESIDKFPADARKNLDNTRAKSAGLKLRYLNDRQCRIYIRSNFDDELLRDYDIEKRGSFRGDLCRSAVLFREGGFYMDLDFQLHVPIQTLINESTTLMTIFAQKTYQTMEEQLLPAPLVLNALIAVEPNNDIMRNVLEKTKDWYADNSGGLLGPTMMQQAISETIKNSCPHVSFTGESRPGGAECGSERFRFYQEEPLGEGKECVMKGEIVCPKERALNGYWGTKIGIFSVGEETRDARLIGWPRFAGCAEGGCGLSGKHIEP